MVPFNCRIVASWVFAIVLVGCGSTQPRTTSEATTTPSAAREAYEACVWYFYKPLPYNPTQRLRAPEKPPRSLKPPAKSNATICAEQWAVPAERRMGT